MFPRVCPWKELAGRQKAERGEGGFPPLTSGCALGISSNNSPRRLWGPAAALPAPASWVAVWVAGPQALLRQECFGASSSNTTGRWAWSVDHGFALFKDGTLGLVVGPGCGSWSYFKMKEATEIGWKMRPAVHKNVQEKIENATGNNSWLLVS